MAPAGRKPYAADTSLALRLVMFSPVSASRTATTGALTVTGPLGGAVDPAISNRLTFQVPVRPSAIVIRAAALCGALADRSSKTGAVSGRSNVSADMATLVLGGVPEGAPATVATAR